MRRSLATGWMPAIEAAGRLADSGGGLAAVVAMLSESAPATLDLTDPANDEPLERTADLLVGVAEDTEALTALDAQLVGSGPLSMRLGVKLAISKRAVSGLAGAEFVSVVFAVYQEHNRIRTREEHPDGENFLNRKIRQLQWLTSERPDVGWELVVVDDGCPDRSGEIVQQIIDESGHAGRARVLFLRDAIDDGVPPVVGLGSPADSRKGGSILLGMWDAVQRHCDAHTVVYTDADLSTHLGQIGLLVGALGPGVTCAAGSRREPTSAVVKKSGRNNRGKLFIYLWKRMLEPLGDIVDTQCGFKAFPASVVHDIVLGNDEHQFAFDIELLLRAELGRRGSIRKVAVAWIDSEAQSTTTDLQPYLPMLVAIGGMYRRYLAADPVADGFAALVDRLDQAAWERLLEDIPQALTAKEPREFRDFGGVSAAELAAAARLGEVGD